MKVFSTTMARDREAMGDRITAWLQGHPELSIVDVVTTQSSDTAYHCLSITFFFEGDATKYLGEVLPESRRPVRPF